MVPYFQPRRVSPPYRIIRAITVEIVSSTKSDGIGLEEAAEVGGVKTVAQIIQAYLGIPLLAGEQMAHGTAASCYWIAVTVIDERCSLQVVTIPLLQNSVLIRDMRCAAAAVLEIIVKFSSGSGGKQAGCTIQITRSRRAAVTRLIFPNQIPAVP